MTESPGFESPREEEEDNNQVFVWENAPQAETGVQKSMHNAPSTGALVPGTPVVIAPIIEPESMPLVMEAPGKAVDSVKEIALPKGNVEPLRVSKGEVRKPPETVITQTKVSEEQSSSNVVMITQSLVSEDTNVSVKREESKYTSTQNKDTGATLTVADATSTVDFSTGKRTLQLSKSLPPMTTGTDAGHVEQGANTERLLTIAHRKETVSDSDIRQARETCVGYVEKSSRMASDQSFSMESESDSSRSESSRKSSVISLTRMLASQAEETQTNVTAKSVFSASKTERFSDQVKEVSRVERMAAESFREGLRHSAYGMSSEGFDGEWSASFSSEDSRRSSILSQASTTVDSCHTSSMHDSRCSSTQDSICSLTTSDSRRNSTHDAPPCKYHELQSPPLEARTSSAQELSKVMPEERLMRLERRRSSTPDTRKPELMRIAQIRHSLKENQQDRPEDIVYEAARISAKEAMKAQWLLSHTPSIDLSAHDPELREMTATPNTPGEQLTSKPQGGLFVKERIQRSKTIDVVSQAETDRALGFGLEPRGGGQTSQTDEFFQSARERHKADWLLSSPSLDQRWNSADKVSSKAVSGKKVELVMRTPANQEKLLDFGHAERKDKKVEMRSQKKWGLMDDAIGSRSGSNSPKAKGVITAKSGTGSPKLGGRGVRPQTPPTKKMAKSDDKPNKKSDGSMKLVTAKLNKIGPGKDSTGKMAKGFQVDSKESSKKNLQKKLEEKMSSTKNVRAVCREVRQAALTKVPAVVVRDVSQDSKKKDKTKRPPLKEQRSLSKELKKETNTNVQSESRKVTGGSIISVREVRSGTSVSPLKRRGMHTSRMEQVQTTTTVHSGGKVDEMKVTKKSSTTTTFMRYSKISFKALLGEHGSEY